MSSVQEPVKRPKGFVSWRPHAKTRRILDQVLEILTMYEANLPLTARQIFYRLVGAYYYPKEELAYNRLCEYLVRARRCGMIRFDYIRDDGTIEFGAGGYFSPEHFWNSTQISANRYYRDRSEGQANSIEVWCEAGGMAPQLSNVARIYGVPVYSTGGFSSVTVTHQVARRVAEDNRPTIFLHIGDLDPSGQSIYEAMSEDIETFVYQYKQMAEEHGYEDGWDWVHPDSDFQYHRVALTMDQVGEYELPTAPPKKSDLRSQNWIGETCQAEAMAPDILSGILSGYITSSMDMDIYHNVIKEEKVERPVVMKQVHSYRKLLDYEVEDVPKEEALPEG